MKMRYKIAILLIAALISLWCIKDAISTIGIGQMFGLSGRTKYIIKDDVPLVTVPGKILFNSDRPDNTVYLLENGSITKFNDIRGRPILSADGRYILHYHRGFFVIRDCITWKIKKIITFPEGYSPVGMDWHPETKKICFTMNTMKGNKSFTNLFTFDIYTKEIKQLTFFEGNTPWGVTNPKFSPDGTKIVFETHKNVQKGDLGPPISIFIINTDGTDLHEIFGDKHWGGGEPSWSLDGKQIVFVSCAPSEEKDDIYICNSDGTNIRAVVNDKWLKKRPVFSPDGKQICYVSPRHGDVSFMSELFVVNIDGTGQARLTDPYRRNDPSPLRKWATDDYPQWSK